MKANKALKRLAKIEALMADVSERYSSGASHIREALRDAMAAFARVKAAVSTQASSGTAKHRPAKRKQAAAAKKSAPIKKAAKKVAAKKKAAAPVKKLPVPAKQSSVPVQAPILEPLAPAVTIPAAHAPVTPLPTV